jgi:hypothetical protein
MNLIGRFDMSISKLALIATMMLLSMDFVLYPQGSANAAKFCAQLRGTTAAGHHNSPAKPPALPERIEAVLQLRE